MMTPGRLRECLEIIGWSVAELSRRLDGVSERNLNRMLSGSATIPDTIADWLEAIVRHMQAAPPPPS
jgi:hypothetical protein